MSDETKYHVYSIQDEMEPGYWNNFNQATVLMLHCMGVIEQARPNTVEGSVTVHWYRRAR